MSIVRINFFFLNQNDFPFASCLDFLSRLLISFCFFFIEIVTSFPFFVQFIIEKKEVTC